MGFTEIAFKRAFGMVDSCDVWVCRDSLLGNYCMFDQACNPKKDMNGSWDCCKCDQNHYIGAFCGDLFKQYTGLKRHMRKGTRKKVRWIYPLQFMEVK